MAILLDYVDPDLSTWMYRVLLNDLKLQVDAIYSYNLQDKPSTLLLDVTQIVNDFRLYSDFQQNYKKTLANSSLFTYVEVSQLRQPSSQLICNGALAHGFTHVKLGRVPSQLDQSQAILNFLLTS